MKNKLTGIAHLKPLKAGEHGTLNFFTTVASVSITEKMPQTYEGVNIRIT